MGRHRSPRHLAALGAAALVVGLAVAIVVALVASTPGDDARSMSSAMPAHHEAGAGPAMAEPVRDPETRRLLRAQLARAREAVAGIRTASDAVQRGYVPVTVDLAFLGVHYLDPKALEKPFAPGRPTHLVFASNDPTATLAGLMYYVESPDGPPDGFAGGQDPWHFHEAACMGGSYMLALDDVTPGACRRLGGEITPLPPKFRDRWMLHVWVAAGARNPWGVFAEGHPALA